MTWNRPCSRRVISLAPVAVVFYIRPMTEDLSSPLINNGTDLPAGPKPRAAKVPEVNTLAGKHPEPHAGPQAGMRAASTASTAADARSPTGPAYLHGLNPPQREAVETLAGPVLVLAGAGTGKTRALTTRIGHLLITGTARPQELLAVTFTNKAAGEMRDRVEALIGQPTTGWWLGTFHSLAARILRIHAGALGAESFNQNFTILDDDDQLRLLKALMTDVNIDPKAHSPRAVLTAISRWKDRGWTPDKVPLDDIPQGLCEGRLGKIYQAYQDRLLALNAADFGDLLLHNLSLFQTNRAILETYQHRFRFILVDEYQDTNVAQYLWLRLLAAKHQNIACVGDDDQSIYGWRGAEVGNILRFETDYPAAKTIRLEQNYRSTGNILAAASALIAHNSERLGKTLFTDDQPGPPLRVRGLPDGNEEARYITDEIERLHREGRDYREFAILVRSSSMMRAIEERMIDVGLPYRVFGGPRFYERREIRDAIAYLRLVRQPDDDLAFERIINVPKRGIGQTTAQRVLSFARMNQISAMRAVDQLVGSDELPAAARKKLVGFRAMVDQWRELMNATEHTELAEQILDDSGYRDMWRNEKTADARGRLENLDELVGSMGNFDSLAGFLEHISLVLDTNAGSGGDELSLMTLHAAKGMEFPVVFLPGWEDGAFPNMRAMTESGDKGLEEERRLAYVGITRARQELFILYVGSRFLHGQWNYARPSRFVEELPADVLDIDDISGASMFAAVTGRDSRNDGTEGYGASGFDAGGGLAQHYGGGAAGARDLGALPPLEWAERRSFRGIDSPGMNRLKQNLKQVKQGSPPVIDGSFDPIGLASQGANHNFELSQRVFHRKFGYGRIITVEGEKLVINFDAAGEKRVMASFVVDAAEAS